MFVASRDTDVSVVLYTLKSLGLGGKCNVSLRTIEITVACCVCVCARFCDVPYVGAYNRGHISVTEIVTESRHKDSNIPVPPGII